MRLMRYFTGVSAAGYGRRCGEASGGTLIVFAQGHGFLEGPRWHAGRLFAASPRGRRIVAFDADGIAEVVYETSGFPLGLGWDITGRILIVSMDDRLLLRGDNYGRTEVFADLGSLSPGSLNDMVVTRNGRAYISALAGNALVTPTAELNEPSTLICVEPDGYCRRVADGLHFPNGLAITADGRTLLVAETFGRRISAFQILPDGSLSDRRDWFVFGPRPASLQGEGAWSEYPAPDGIAIDADDGLWVGDAGGNGAFRVKSGEGITDFVETGPHAAVAVTLGGPDGKTLYLCASPPHANGPAHAEIGHLILSCRVEVGAVPPT
jgi:sugar lactone lactonase YvrE